MVAVERLRYGPLAHSLIIPFNLKGSAVNYDNENISTAEIKSFLAHRKRRFLLRNYQSFIS